MAILGLDSKVTYNGVTTIRQLAERGAVTFGTQDWDGRLVYFAELAEGQGWRITKQAFEAGVRIAGETPVSEAEPKNEEPKILSRKERTAALVAKYAESPYPWIVEADYGGDAAKSDYFLERAEPDKVAELARAYEAEDFTTATMLIETFYYRQELTCVTKYV